MQKWSPKFHVSQPLYLFSNFFSTHFLCKYITLFVFLLRNWYQANHNSWTSRVIHSPLYINLYYYFFLCTFSLLKIIMTIGYELWLTWGSIFLKYLKYHKKKRKITTSETNFKTFSMSYCYFVRCKSKKCVMLVKQTWKTRLSQNMLFRF